METENTTTEATAPIGIGAALAPEVTETEDEGAAITTPEPGDGVVPAAKEEAAPAPAAAAPEKNPQVSGVLKGIQAERSRRQAAELENKELRGRLAQLEGTDPAAVETQAAINPVPAIERKLLTISENSARTAHPDYEEKFAAFAAVAEKNPALYESVMESDHPGEAAYQAGRTVLFQQKYGADPEGMVKKIREETETEMKAKIRAEVEAELRGKVASKNNQPKNILAGRGARGGEQDTVPVIGFSQLLAKRPRKN